MVNTSIHCWLYKKQWFFWWLWLFVFVRKCSCFKHFSIWSPFLLDVGKALFSSVQVYQAHWTYFHSRPIFQRVSGHSRESEMWQQKHLEHQHSSGDQQGSSACFWAQGQQVVQGRGVQRAQYVFTLYTEVLLALWPTLLIWPSHSLSGSEATGGFQNLPLL